MTCAKCGEPLTGSDGRCARCGADAGGRDAAEVSGLLARANLHRVRGEWEEAEALCVKVMRLDPNNVDAHSMLGDIFRDQGKPEEAAQWYQMSLDLKPDSRADLCKLTAVEAEVARRDALANGGGQDTSAPRVMGLAPSTWFAGVWAAAAVFLVVVLALAFGRARAPSSVPVPAPTGTVAAAPVPPAPVPAQAPPQTDRSAAALPPGPGTAGLPPAASPRAAVEGALAASSEWSVAGMVEDPRDRRTHIDLALAPGAALDDEVLAAGALTAARAALAARPGVAVATVVVRMPNARGAMEAVFAGDAQRAAVEALRPDYNAEQALAAFTNVWRPVPAM